MNLRLDMLQAARSAPDLLRDAGDGVVEFLRGQFNHDGGAKNRSGKSDLYYTVFALDGLAAMGVEVPVEAGERTECRIVLRLGFDLSGVLLDHERTPEPERPLLLEGPGNLQKMVRSGPDGAWGFTGLKEGTYRVWCPTPDLASEHPPVDIEVKDDVSGVEIVLPPPPDLVEPGEEAPPPIDPTRLPEGLRNRGDSPVQP